MSGTIWGKSGYRIWVGIWICAVVLRLIFPLADPPQDLSWSGGYYSDEGFWTHDARNLIIFGEYGNDEWHDRYVSPLIHPIILTLFKFIGPGLLATRIWASGFSILALFFLLLILKNEKWGLQSFIFMSFSAVLVAYQRIALLETAAIFGGCITLWLFINARRKKSRTGYLLFGISVAATYLLKGTQIYMFPAALTAIYLSPGNLKQRFWCFKYWVSGILIVLGPYLFLVYFPHSESLAQYSAYYAAQHGSSLMELAGNIVLQPVLIYMNRFPFLFPAAWLAIILFPRIRNNQEIRPVLDFSYSWMVWGFVIFSPLGYRPFRYYAPLIVPVIIMGSWLWDYLGTEKASGDQRVSENSTGRVIQWIWISIPLLINIAVLGEGIILGGRFLGYAGMPGFSHSGALALIIVSICLLFFSAGNRIRENWIRGLCIAALILQGLWLTNWHINRNYSIYETSCSLNEMLPENSVVAGQWAPELCLETPFKAIPLWKGFVNDKDPFSSYGITHVLSWEYPWGNELILQQEWFPETMSSAKYLKTFMIKDTSVSLWEIPEGPVIPAENSMISAESNQP